MKNVPEQPAVEESDRIGPLENPRHERFCQEYLIDLNATKAYMRAGYKVKPRVAATAGGRLLTNVEVAGRVAELQAERGDRTQVTVDRVVTEIGIVSFSNIEHYTTDENGYVQVREDAPEGAIRAISGIKIKRRTIPQRSGGPIVEVDTDIKLWSKPTGLQLAGQHLGLYKERHEHSGPDGGPIPVQGLSDEQIMARVAVLAERLTGDGGDKSK